MQKICTEGNGENIPIKKDNISVTEVMVIETAASDNMMAILSGTGSLGGVLRHAANITNVSSIPIPVIEWKILNSCRGQRQNILTVEFHNVRIFVNHSKN